MVRVTISGYVQGVGFRQFVKKHAVNLNIKGWVKNIPASRQGGSNGKVEAVFIGDEKNVQKMLEHCKKGPFLAEVKEVQIEKHPYEEFETFEIVN